jgi:uncharacterized protein YdeI (YjbR/CyaY-like superfamily)
MKPIFFNSPAAFRRWLEENHATSQELYVGYYKKHTGKPSLTWSESVDEALCFGWIDGIRRSWDEEGYIIRFTPRRKQSIWSAINRKKVKELTREGRMMPAGLAAWKSRDPEKTNRYSFEQRETAKLPPEMEKQFRANRKAWAFFESQPPGYRRIISFYVMSAKQDATRQRRLERLIRDSAAGRRVGILERPKPRSSGGSRKSGKAPSRGSSRTPP